MGRPLGSRNVNGNHRQIVELATGPELLSLRQIGDRFGITATAVCIALKSEGVKKPVAPRHANYLTGPAHPQWKGDDAKANHARYRSHTVIPTLGTCEGCGQKPAEHRHHVDRNPKNNELSNLQQLCASCHAKAHGRKPPWWKPAKGSTNAA